MMFTFQNYLCGNNWRKIATMSAKKELKAKAEKIYNELLVSQVNVKRLTNILRSYGNNQMTTALENLHQSHQYIFKNADTFLEQTQKKVISQISQINVSGGLEISSWQGKQWGEFNVITSGYPPEYIRIGTLNTGTFATPLPDIPAMLPITKSNHVFVFYPRNLKQEGIYLIESIAWRIAAFSPIGSYRFTLVDTTGTGTNFSELLELPDSIRGSKIYCQDLEIEQILQVMVNHIEEVNQQRLRKKYVDIADYNDNNPLTAIPYHFIFINSLPEGFSDKALEILLSIARTGIHAGVHLIIGCFKEKWQDDGKLQKMFELANCISVVGENLAEWDDVCFADLKLNIDKHPSKTLTDLISVLVSENLPKTKSLNFEQIMPSEENFWKGNSTYGLRTRIGLDKKGDFFNFELGAEKDGFQNAFHALIGGSTGNGKTNFLHLLISSLSLIYSPEELELYLVDFKPEGIEFQDYVKGKLPHAKAIVIQAEREYGLSILEHLDDEMNRRGNLFGPDHANVNDLIDYRKKTGKSMPRILGIMDEFTVLFEENDQLASSAFEKMLRIVSLGRAYGIHLILSSQRPTSETQSLTAIKSQIPLRVAFACNNQDDSELILGDGNGHASTLDQVGLACITYHPNNPVKTTQIKIGFIPPLYRNEILEEIHFRYKANSNQNAQKTIIFSRREPAIWRNNKYINRILSNDNYLFKPGFWVGVPIKIADDVTINFNDHERDNLIIIGSNEELANRLLFSGFLGELLTNSKQKAQYIFYQSSIPDSITEPFLEELKMNMPNFVEIPSRSGIVESIKEIDIELENRRKAIGNIKHEPIYMFFQGLHRIQEIQSFDICDEDSIGKSLFRIWKDGPKVGIHSLVWVDKTETLGDITQNSSMTCLIEFSHRIACQMSSDESNLILENISAAKLGKERILYQNASQSLASYKVKPYLMPTLRDIREVAQFLR